MLISQDLWNEISNVDAANISGGTSCQQANYVFDPSVGAECETIASLGSGFIVPIGHICCVLKPSGTATADATADASAPPGGEATTKTTTNTSVTDQGVTSSSTSSSSSSG